MLKRFIYTLFTPFSSHMSGSPSSRFAIKCGLLLDGTGKDPLHDIFVVVNNGKIESISKNVDGPIEVVDAGNYTVMPGLIDSHLHLAGHLTDKFVEESIVTPYEIHLIKALYDIQDLLSAGYTTVRDCGSLQGPYLKMAVESGLTKGPRIVTSGRVLTQTFGHGDEHYFPVEIVKLRSEYKLGFGGILCDGVDECIKAARTVFREGADFIKICSTGGVMSQRDKPEDEQFTVEEIRAIVNEAKKVRSFVASHAQGAKGIKNALVAGVRTIEHGIYLDEEGAKMMIEQDAIMVPTLSIVHQLVSKGKEVGTPEWGLKKSLEVIDTHVKNVKKAKSLGVKIATGTDFIGSPMLKFGANAMELQLLVEKCDFTPMEAIVAATKNGADACGLLNKTGTLEVGKCADIIAVKGNPLEDVKLLQNKENIKFVIKGGVIVA
ncbi:MAG: amidohydrolase family protein [Nitrososphaeria archaeon]|nr:amidohydrolase family protein [Nitrososphaeria archaeon]